MLKKGQTCKEPANVFKELAAFTALGIKEFFRIFFFSNITRYLYPDGNNTNWLFSGWEVSFIMRTTFFPICSSYKLLRDLCGLWSLSSSSWSSGVYSDSSCWGVDALHKDRLPQCNIIIIKVKSTDSNYYSGKSKKKHLKRNATL